MSATIHTIQPSEIWKHFYALTQIPRPSGHEAAVVEHIRQFAEQNKLAYDIDEVGNIIIRKPAQNKPGDSIGVILQSHVDMVPQKNNDKQHDFEKDPIETRVVDGYLYADNTTLGADNGIGVAAMMAVLGSKSLSHGPIEALFTINEESGMDGAFGLKSDVLKGKVLLNLDTEEDDELCVGCAGGIDANVEGEIPLVVAGKGMVALKMNLKGLKGGHSGIDIHLGRGNANKIMARLLYSMNKNFEMALCSFHGGNMRNAIPREAEAVVLVKADQASPAMEAMNLQFEIIKNELGRVEKQMSLEITNVESPSQMFDFEATKKILSALKACPNGVMRMSNEIEGLVETSLNLSIVKLDDGRADIKLLIRSAVDSAKYSVGELVEALFSLLGYSTKFGGDYPGWSPNSESYVLEVAQNVYEKEFKVKPHVLAVHAGLECGIIGGKYQGLDMISFGPTIDHPHSPEERVSISSVGKFWNYLQKVLEAL